MGILLIVFPFSISSTYFRKSRSRWKPYGVSTEYGGFPLTPFSFVFGGKLLPGGVKTRHQCLFRGNILRIFFFTFLFFHHVPVFSLTNRFFSLISEKRKNQITSQTAIKHKHSRREYPEISRGKITFYLRFHWNLSHNSVLLLFLHLSSPALFFSHSCCFISSRLLLFNGDGPDFHLITALPWTGAGNSLKVFRPTGTFNSHRQEHRRPLLWLALFLAETFVPLLHVESSSQISVYLTEMSFSFLRCVIENLSSASRRSTWSLHTRTVLLTTSLCGSPQTISTMQSTDKHHKVSVLSTLPFIINTQSDRSQQISRFCTSGAALGYENVILIYIIMLLCACII